ncbi:hypothetical protein IE53DRAFT_390630, partial [Violaceomyces palustris]
MSKATEIDDIFSGKKVEVTKPATKATTTKTKATSSSNKLVSNDEAREGGKEKYKMKKKKKKKKSKGIEKEDGDEGMAEGAYDDVDPRAVPEGSGGKGKGKGKLAPEGGGLDGRKRKSVEFEGHDSEDLEEEGERRVGGGSDLLSSDRIKKRRKKGRTGRSTGEEADKVVDPATKAGEGKTKPRRPTPVVETVMDPSINTSSSSSSSKRLSKPTSTPSRPSSSSAGMFIPDQDELASFMDSRGKR